MRGENKQQSTRFSFVIPNEMRMLIQKKARKFRVSEAAIIKLAIVEFFEATGDIKKS